MPFGDAQFGYPPGGGGGGPSGGKVTGEIWLWGGAINSIPAGSVHCNGGSLLIAQFPALYAALKNGVIWGTAGGAGTFQVPNLQDVVLPGASSDVGNVPTTTFSGGTLRNGGVSLHNHGISDPQHSHAYGGSTFGHTHGYSGSTNGHTHNYNGTTNNDTNSTFVDTLSPSTNATQSPHSHSYGGTTDSSTDSYSGTTNSSTDSYSGTSSNQSTGITVNNESTVPPFITMVYCIKT